MKAIIKIPNNAFEAIHMDLHRPHEFAYERVGFIFAGCTWLEENTLLLTFRDYSAVADIDYLNDRSAGAVIGPDAIRKGLQGAYKARSALLHVHSHGGAGNPSFSQIDLISAQKFVPSFFNAIPKMPHGLIVLSNNSAHGLLWHDPKEEPIKVFNFVSVGAPYRKFGE